MDIEDIITARVKAFVSIEVRKGTLLSHIGPKMGLPSATITHLFNGTQKKPRISLVMGIINKMGVDPLWLTGEIGTESNVIYLDRNYNSSQGIEPNG